MSVQGGMRSAQSVHALYFAPTPTVPTVDARTPPAHVDRRRVTTFGAITTTTTAGAESELSRTPYMATFGRTPERGAAPSSEVVGRERSLVGNSR